MEKLGRLIRSLSEQYIGKYLEESDSLFIVNYSKVSAPQLSLFRSIMKENMAHFVVVKNSIASRAFRSKGFERLSSMLEGPCGVVFSKGDPVTVCKAIFNFAKENEGLKVKGGLLKETVLSLEEVTELSKLPSREILYAKVVQLLNAPMGLLVMTLKEIPSRLVRVLNSIKDKK